MPCSSAGTASLADAHVDIVQRKNLRLRIRHKTTSTDGRQPLATNRYVTKQNELTACNANPGLHADVQPGLCDGGLPTKVAGSKVREVAGLRTAEIL